METIKLEFNSEIKTKILEFLASFSPDELHIIEEDSQFTENKQKLQVSADKLNNGTAEFISFEELDILLEKTISKHEN